MYPDDVFPETGCRLPPLDRADLDPATQAIYDSQTAAGGRSLRGLRGPGGIALHSPRLAQLRKPLNTYLRFEAGIAPRVRETAILVTARCCESRFEWAAHEPEALNVGVPKETIEAIRRQAPVESAHPEDGLVIQLGRAIFIDRHVPSPLYKAACAQLGTRQLLDLVALMGNFAATAALLTAFDMQLDPGTPAPF